MAFYHGFTKAITRQIPLSFAESSVCIEQPLSRIDIELARKQHENYINVIKSVLGSENVVEMSPVEEYPDCCFVEDPVVCVTTDCVGSKATSTAMVNNLGHQSRRGEYNTEFKKALKDSGKIDKVLYMKNMGEKGAEIPTMDGGDVLFTGHHVFVGISSRTNMAGFTCLKTAFESDRLHCIPIHLDESTSFLHLKSIATLLDMNTIIVADTKEGHSVWEQVSKWQLDKPCGCGFYSYSVIFVPQALASNCVRVRDRVICANCFYSVTIIKEYFKEKKDKVIVVDMSELSKADGALTCCSVLL